MHHYSMFFALLLLAGNVANAQDSRDAPWREAEGRYKKLAADFILDSQTKASELEGMAAAQEQFALGYQRMDDRLPLKKELVEALQALAASNRALAQANRKVARDLTTPPLTGSVAVMEDYNDIAKKADAVAKQNNLIDKILGNQIAYFYERSKFVNTSQQVVAALCLARDAEAKVQFYRNRVYSAFTDSLMAMANGTELMGAFSLDVDAGSRSKADAAKLLNKATDSAETAKEYKDKFDRAWTVAKACQDQ